MEERKVLLIGGTGSGKSTICNVMSGTNDFMEGEYGVSETKEHLKKEYIIDGVKYIIVDTIGIYDTSQISTKEVLYNIAKGCYAVRGGISQVFFLCSVKFTNAEIQCFDLLTKVLFNPEIAKYTTIVRTRFPRYQNQECTEKDKDLLLKSNPKMKSIIKGCNKIIHVNNMSIYEDKTQEARNDCRKILLTHLYNCRDVYKPVELDELNDKIKNYMTEEEIIEVQLKELSQSLEEASKTNQKLAETFEIQKKELDKKLKETQEEAAAQVKETIKKKSGGWCSLF
ncbi:hypothetical protein CYY_001171 [Polysphondylium violaceum]|uniref:AIG1-type G domain-containing protein n=1 Tax=Polysphondylium violaceum TaxID=133409 RepID=A0A8J4PYM7_9MYCE|nr:hypothetical protein CYY_001171 [Polysphondylium violaceum]